MSSFQTFRRAFPSLFFMGVPSPLPGMSIFYNVLLLAHDTLQTLTNSSHIRCRYHLRGSLWLCEGKAPSIPHSFYLSTASAVREHLHKNTLPGCCDERTARNLDKSSRIKNSGKFLGCWPIEKCSNWLINIYK